MGACGGRTPAVCIARVWLEDANCGLAPAGFGAGQAPIPSFPQRREGAVRVHQRGSSGKLSSYEKSWCSQIFESSQTFAAQHPHGGLKARRIWALTSKNPALDSLLTPRAAAKSALHPRQRATYPSEKTWGLSRTIPANTKPHSPPPDTAAVPPQPPPSTPR